MNSRWIIAGAAALSLALLTLPMLRKNGAPINPSRSSASC